MESHLLSAPMGFEAAVASINESFADAAWLTGVVRISLRLTGMANADFGACCSFPIAQVCSPPAPPLPPRAAGATPLLLALLTNALPPAVLL